MKSAATDVDGYISEQLEGWRDTLQRFRHLCRRLLPGHTEEMAHGMPTYSRAGRMEVAFAKQVNYLSFYVLKESVLHDLRPRLEGLTLGKGCIRYRRAEQVDWSVVEDLLRATADSSEEPC
jgi:uncharacterized protein YdhG (YjbR/CyaY superfamily)